MGPQRARRGGIGRAAARRADGLVVAALVAVNAVGDVLDPAPGEVIAGVRGEDGELVDLRRVMRAGFADPLTASEKPSSGENTTIGVVATNARLSQAQATKVAQMAHDGLARAIYPSHTPWDGDTIFALATGDFEGEADLATVGTLAADLVAEAILRAVRAARSLPDVPAAGDPGLKGN